VILTDREIELAIKHGQIELDPPPDDDAYSSTSLDLTLAENAEIWESPKGVKLFPGTVGFKYDTLKALKKSISLKDYTLERGAFVLGWTRETVGLPIGSRLAARVEGKSSLARLGIGIHLTAPTIHAGFKAQIQLEITNVSPNQIVLAPGMRVCQLIFEATLGTPVKGYAGQFMGQKAV